MILTAFGFDSVVQLLSRELFTIYTRMLAHTVVERMLHHRTELSLSVTNTLFLFYKDNFIRTTSLVFAQKLRTN